MPTNRDHKKAAMQVGIGPTLGKQVDRMLDYPTDPMTGAKLDHREVHDMRGIMMAYMMFGWEGAKAAMMHILMDMFFDETNTTRDMALYGQTYRQPSHR
jgi:hypothetical protein